jgi:hypothetical protein
MSLKLNSSGGGSVTLQEPVTASNLTLDLPDNSGTVVVSSTPTGVDFNSGSVGSNPRTTLPSGSFGGGFSFLDTKRAGMWAQNQGEALVFFTNHDSTTAAANQSRLIVNSAGLGLGASNPATNGIGIKFPATQVASSDANTLDDYEEGFWTPAWNTTNFNMSVSYSTQIGRYTKIGRMVYLTGYIKPSSISNQGTGQIIITGLPFSIVEEVGFTVSDGNAFRNYLSSTQSMMTCYGNGTFTIRPATVGSGGNSYGVNTGSLTADFFLFTAYYPT